VDKVVLPEYEQGQYLAVELLNPGVIEQFDLGPGYRVSEIKVPHAFVGKRVNEVNLRAAYQCTLLVVKRDSAVEVIPPPTHEFLQGDVLVVVGSDAGMDKLVALES
jgi:trk system potassium uptake protein TrkA